MKYAIPHALVMVRPKAFGFNGQTADSNPFQQTQGTEDFRGNATRALQEFDQMVELLSSHDIDLRVFEDPGGVEKPDAVFPNNWVSFHPDGRVVLYPMMAENRRAERRMDIIDGLKNDFEVTEVVDLRAEEKRGRFLEGTGSMIFDHRHRRIFASRSLRTNEELVKHVADIFEYRPVIFDAFDTSNKPVYHTNVVLSIGKKFAVVCLDAIHREDDQERILDAFSESSTKVVAISYAQMNAFAGNIIEVRTESGDPVVLLSQSAFQSLLKGQVNAISAEAELLPIAIPTIEKYGGGSVRCMVAGVHLPKRNSL
jgi:hypothetical protein